MDDNLANLAVLTTDNDQNQAFQHTLAQTVTFEGKGLHTGKRTKVRLHPANSGTGIRFRRVDPKGQNIEIPATMQYAKPLVLSSGIRHPSGIQIRTIEHLMAALYACSIDNVLIEIKGEEVPILDGSASPFVDGILQNGIYQQNAARQCIRILKRIRVEKDNRSIQIEPADTFSGEFTLTLRAIGKQYWRGPLDPASFRETIVKARTFTPLRRAIQGYIMSRLAGVPLGRGASLANTLVVTRKGVLNKGGLRVPDELVRHRVLDAVGDLMLSGAHIIGHLVAYRTCHALNQALVSRLLETPDAWSWDTRQ